MDKELVHQMLLMIERSLREGGLPPPLLPCSVKEESFSLPPYRMKEKPASPLSCNHGGIQIGSRVKQEPASLTRNHAVQSMCPVKDATAYPSPHSQKTPIDGPSSPPRHNRHGWFINDELPPTIDKAQLHPPLPTAMAAITWAHRLSCLPRSA